MFGSVCSWFDVERREISEASKEERKKVVQHKFGYEKLRGEMTEQQGKKETKSNVIAAENRKRKQK